MKYLFFILKIIIIFLIIIFLMDCTHIYYSPRTQPVPFFKDKNELLIEGNIMANLPYSGLQGNIAYAPINHLGMFANYSTGKSELWDYEDPDRGRELYDEEDILRNTEVAVGYFNYQNPQSVELYIGYGKGNTKSKYYINSSLDSYYEQFFIQPSYNYIHDGIFNGEFSFSYRFSYLVPLRKLINICHSMTYC